MDGKRFAMGLIAGVLVGLAVVASSGGLGSAQGLASLVANKNSGNLGATVSTTASQTSSTPGGNGLPISSLNSTKVSVSTSSTTVNNPQDLSANKAFFTPTAPTFSSRLANIVQQPLVSNAVILAPLLLAIILGAVLYRASVRSREDAEE